MKKTVLIIIAGWLYACGPSENRETTTAVEEVLENLEERVTGSEWVVYEGDIPCIDCDEIQVELWLENDSSAVTPDYRLVMNYINTPVGDTEEEVEGNYTIISGYDRDRDATLFQLNPGTNEPRYFVLNDDRSITMLGEDMQPLDEGLEGDLDYNLELKEAD
jgi:hypothetical protein